MKATTQSCSGKKLSPKSRENLQKTPTKKHILQQSFRLETPPHTGILQGSYPGHELLFITNLRIIW